MKIPVSEVTRLYCPECILGRDAQHIKEIILRSWSDHMWNFEHMDEEDEQWLLRWAGHPSASNQDDDFA